MDNVNDNNEFYFGPLKLFKNIYNNLSFSIIIKRFSTMIREIKEHIINKILNERSWAERKIAFLLKSKINNNFIKHSVIM